MLSQMPQAVCDRFRLPRSASRRCHQGTEQVGTLKASDLRQGYLARMGSTTVGILCGTCDTARRVRFPHVCDKYCRVAIQYCACLNQSLDSRDMNLHDVATRALERALFCLDVTWDGDVATWRSPRSDDCWCCVLTLGFGDLPQLPVELTLSQPGNTVSIEVLASCATPARYAASRVASLERLNMLNRDTGGAHATLSDDGTRLEARGAALLFGVDNQVEVTLSVLLTVVSFLQNTIEPNLD
jgi:hypothetical protein